MRVLVPDNWSIPPLSTATFRTFPTRSASNSSTSSTSTVSPTKRSRQSYSATKRPAPRASSLARRVVTASGGEQPGRFERDFGEIDELGSGEFGKVIKVRSKNKGNHESFAIKTSKRLEGARHRLRLRGEVDVLKHLAQRSRTPAEHPNVLGYIDNWEGDEALFIQTELCESGNLAHFLWQYGRVFPRLDEARVWKIIVGLSKIQIVREDLFPHTFHFHEREQAKKHSPLWRGGAGEQEGREQYSWTKGSEASPSQLSTKPKLESVINITSRIHNNFETLPLYVDDSGWEDNNVFQSGAEDSSPARPSPGKVGAALLRFRWASGGGGEDGVQWLAQWRLCPVLRTIHQQTWEMGDDRKISPKPPCFFQPSGAVVVLYMTTSSPRMALECTSC
ncbi:kinase-like domain-containing protein [Amanita rubescens]|nr:kinase-like domain-containing protein [Amanita rubescens]